MINSVKSLGKMCGIIKDNEDEEEYWLEIHKINAIKMDFKFAFAIADSLTEDLSDALGRDFAEYIEISGAAW